MSKKKNSDFMPVVTDEQGMTNEVTIKKSKGDTLAKKLKKLRNHDALSKAKLIEMAGSKSYNEMLKFVKSEIVKSEQMISFNYQFKCFMEDGAYAMHRAIEEVQGYAQQAEKKSMSGSEPPQMIDVKFPDGSRLKVPWGKINLPELGNKESPAFMEISYNNQHRTMYVQGQAKSMYKGLLDEIMTYAEEFVKRDSIYRNQAISLDKDLIPTFMDVSDMDNKEIFLSKTAQYELELITARITQPGLCQAHGIDLSIGALMVGDYGTGKTLQAFKLARLATMHNWNFVYMKENKYVAKALEIAHEMSSNGTGSVVFIEDIDMVLKEERDDVLNQIGLLLDGGETKSNPVITLFSTNHLEQIDPNFLRGKRTGSIIKFDHLNEDTADKMIKAYLGDLLDGDIEESVKLAEELEIVPAFMAEILDSCKTRLVINPDIKFITDKQISAAIASFKAHMEMAKLKDPAPSKEKVFYEAFRNMFEHSKIGEDLTELSKHVFDNI